MVAQSNSDAEEGAHGAPRADANQDVTHQDATHQDVTHQDDTHQDAAHQDAAHQDAAHQDAAHQDAAHQDATHEGVTNENVELQDVQEQVAENAVDNSGSTSILIERMAKGEADAAEQLYPLLFKELHGMARRLMRGERNNHTLQTTALVNEAWIRFKPDSSTPETRAQFMYMAARAMRRVLIDHARKRNAKKRDGGERHSLLDDVLARVDGDVAELLSLDDALDKLGARDKELRQLVELRFYAGFTLEESGALMGMTVRQVHRRWTFARGWLRRELERGRPND